MNISNNSKSSYNNESPIAFFDSGVGGLTVFSKVKRILPNENYLYFGDLKNSPYGEKSKEDLVNFAKEIFDFFARKNVKAVVMACNTTSAVVYDELKNDYDYKIYPIIQSCASVIANQRYNRIGVFATEATVKSGVYERELKKYNKDIKVFSSYCPEWVSIVEEKKFDSPDSLNCVKKYLDVMLANKPDKIVLGCTHYPFLINILSRFAPREMFIDPSVAFSEYIKNDLEKSGLLNFNNSSIFEEFYVSAQAEKFKIAAEMFYSLDNLPEVVNLK